LLKQNAEVLTKHFYKRMFINNPEILPLFNHSNQESGIQQKALAAAIVGYAANIDNLGALTNIITLIANKHVALQIKPEHYPIVGEHLLASIKEVLREKANKDVIKAWEEAYWFL